MLFRRKIQRSCTYCLHSTALDERQVLCSKKGIRSCDASCRRFQYDPCKRIPARPKAVDFTKYDDHDYSL